MKAYICLSLCLMVTLPSISGVFFDGGLTLTGLNAGGLAVASSAGSSVFLTSAGVAAAGVGLLGAGVVAAAIADPDILKVRFKRDATSKVDLPASKLAALQVLDGYFMTILDQDHDDCGKRLVCEIETVAKEERTPEEVLIGNMFGESTTIDPLSGKAEYDIAAFIGAHYNKETCARRYHRCGVDRVTLVKGLAKLEKQRGEEQTQTKSDQQ